MPAFKLTTYLYENRKLTADWEIWLKNQKDGISEKILKAENAREQIDYLKNVQKWIDSTWNNLQEEHGSVVDMLKFLVHLFFISTNKNPIRRVLISYFQNLPNEVKHSTVEPQIQTELLTLCEDLPLYGDCEVDANTRIQKNLELRHNVDTISALIENFGLGEDCVAKISIEIVSYLGKLQDNFYRTFRPELSPLQKNETMHHCMEAVKLTNRICQRSVVTMERRLKDPDMMVLFKDTVNKWLQADISIIIHNEFLLDCKTTSAMNLCLMLNLSDCGDQLMSILCETVFKHCGRAPVFNQSGILPQWCAGIGLDGLTKARLTSSAYLCVCYGVLSMVDIKCLLQVHEGKCFILDILLPELLDLSKKVTDVGSKLLAAKSLFYLTQRIRTFMVKGSTDSVDATVYKRLNGGYEDMKTILEYIWTSWEDAVEAVRFTVKDIFENIVSIHLLVSQTSALNDPFLSQLTISILKDVSWSCKGKYGTLTVLVCHIGSTRMLELNPGIANEVLQQLEEQTLSCYVRDLYDELCTSHLKELKAEKHTLIEKDGNQSIDWSLWFNCWVEPVINMLCQSTKIQKKHLIEYVLPKLLKTSDKTLHYMIKTLSEHLHETSGEKNTRGRGDQLGALIMCLRRARAMGLLCNTSTSTGSAEKTFQTSESRGKQLLFGVVEIELLEYALAVKDEQIRLDAFALLCESQKTTEIIDDPDIQLVQTFIPQNMTNQNPAFRQLLLSYLKKLLSRMKESMQGLRKQMSKVSMAKDHVTSYLTFWQWLSNFMLNCLYPGSTFPRRTTALNTLSLLIDTFNGKTDSFAIFELVQPSDIQSLFHCLTDTFEDNKVEATRILITCFRQSIPSLQLTPDVTKEYFDLAMTLSVSCRPQDGLTGAYLLQVLIHHPRIYEVLKNKASLLYSSDSQKKSENSRSIVLARSDDKKELSPFHVLLDVDSDGESERMALLLWILLKSLEDQTEVASSNLLVAAADKPLYPTMLCIRYLLCKIQFRKIEKKYHQCWNDFLSRFISLCLNISEIVSPVVHNCSPEGNIPVEAISGSLHNRPDVSESEKTVMLMPEYLTVCCWRTVKEISLILGQLTSDLPPLDMGSDPNSGLLSYNQILSIGDYFTTQLLESKHRGAFELAYAGFIKVTDMLWRSSIPEFHSLPKAWLQEVMTNIVSDDPTSRLCATRRSAGIPFYVQAIVSTEPSSTGRVCFKTTMDSLIELAYSEPSPENCNPKVHALNILRMLYKDSKLRDDVTPYSADGLKVAILGFKSHLWAVRNAATLLMAAMMNRVFGVKRSKDESSLSRKNCQTGKTFFFKYPTLYQFLLDELSEATENIGTQLHPGLYPILMVLGRLFPSTMEGTDTALNLGAFIPFVVRCCSSPVFKTRMMAARALQPLVEKDHVITVFSDLLTLLPCSQKDGIRQNQVHGVLLQLQYMLKTVSMLPRSTVERLGDILCSTWSQKMDFLISRSNPCMLTRTCALEVTAEVLASFNLNRVILEKLVAAIYIEITDMSDSVIYSTSLPSLSRFMCTVCEIYIQCMCTYFTQEVKTGFPPNNTESNSLPDKLLGTSLPSELLGTSVESKRLSTNDTMKEDYSNRYKVAVEEDTGNSNILHSFEDVCCKFLSSRSYEVRISFLQKITDICLQGSNRVCDNVNVEDKNSEVLESEMDLFTLQKNDSLGQPMLEGFLLQLTKSDKIYKLLLQMCMIEKHKECQLALLRLLKTYPYISQKIVNSPRFYQPVVEVIGFWLHRLEHMELCEEVVSSCIEYLGTSLCVVCGQERNINGITSLAHLEKFTFILRNLSERTETAVSVQLACARAIVKISHCTVLQGMVCVNRQGGDKLCTVEDEVKIRNKDGDLGGAQVQISRRGGAKTCGPMGEVKRETEHGDLGGVKECVIAKGGGEMCQLIDEVKIWGAHEDVGGVKIWVSSRGRAKTIDGNLGCVEVWDGSRDGVRTTDGDNFAKGFQSGTLSSACIENFYRAILDLLQVDDLEVKDTITDVMTIISNKWTRGSPQSYICTSLLIENWIRTNPDVSLVASQLLHLILEEREPEQREDERLFDRGEMNTFRDEIDFVQVVDTFLMKLLLKEGLTGENACRDMDSSNKVNRVAVSKATEFSCDRELCDKLLPVILSFIQPVIPQCSSQDGFLDCSKHEDYVLHVYKNMLCFKYGLIMTQDTDVSISVLGKWKTFQSSLNISVLPSCIMKCYNDVCDSETAARTVHFNP